jgi:RNA polymerase sigma factor (TIGR02999 family)
MSELDDLVAAWRQGDAEASERLFSQIYPELQRLASRSLSAHQRGLTLDTGSLVHEACMRLLGSDQALESALHLRAVAATAMRQIIVDHARRHLSHKRGGALLQVTLGQADGNASIDALEPADLLEIEMALQKLAALGERPVRVAECRFFAGMSEQETAEALGISRSTVQREWRKTQAWLKLLRGQAEAGPD